MPSDDFRKAVQQGDKGRDVKLAQEWLCYHGCSTVVDGVFGPATEVAVENFQNQHSLAATGVVDSTTQAALLAPIVAAQAPIEPGTRPLGELIVAYARQHLQQRPVEIGGPNSGPWVRLYMSGKEGAAWPWCAGFATWVLRQACRTLKIATPHPYAFGCGSLASAAQGTKRFLRSKTIADLAVVKPGFLFLVRKTLSTWEHVGIVERIDGQVLTTIEGNTNDSGSADGYEVCRRTRSAGDKDYLTW